MEFRQVLVNLAGFSLHLFSSSVQKYYYLLPKISQLALFFSPTLMELLFYVAKFLFFSYKSLLSIRPALEGNSSRAFIKVNGSQCNLASSILIMGCSHLSAIGERKCLTLSAAVIKLAPLYFPVNTCQLCQSSTSSGSLETTLIVFFYILHGHGYHKCLVSTNLYHLLIFCCKCCLQVFSSIIQFLSLFLYEDMESLKYYIVAIDPSS